jgi:hypothetical protein
MGEVTDHQEEKTMGELELALKENRKSPGTDNLQVGLHKFEGTALKKQRVIFFQQLAA